MSSPLSGQLRPWLSFHVSSGGVEAVGPTASRLTMPRRPRKDNSKSVNRSQRLASAWADLWAAYDHHAEGRHSSAEFVLRRALKNLRGLSSGADVDEPLAICLSNLVSVLDELGQFSAAEAYGKEALGLGEADACLHGNLAGLYKGLDRYPEAEAASLGSLELRR